MIGSDILKNALVGITVLLLVLTPQIGAAKGGSNTGGGYLDRNGNKLLDEVIPWFAQDLRGLPRSAFDPKTTDATWPEVPVAWTADRIAAVIERVLRDPTNMKKRDGHFLLMDYNRKNNTITALGPFFFAYAHVPQDGYTDPQTLSDVRVKLLHEVSHLWGFTADQQSYEFARDIVFQIPRNNMECKTDGDIPRLNEPLILLYNFSSKGGYLTRRWEGRLKHFWDVTYDPESAGLNFGGVVTLTEDKVKIVGARIEILTDRKVGAGHSSKATILFEGQEYAGECKVTFPR